MVEGGGLYHGDESAFNLMSQFFFRNMGPLGSRPRCSVLVYICVNMQLELELKRGFCSSNIQTLKTSTLQKSRGSRPLFPDFNKNREDPVASRLPKYPPTAMGRSAFKIPKAQQACCCSNSGQVPLTNGEVLNAFPLSKQIRM